MKPVLPTLKDQSRVAVAKVQMATPAFAAAPPFPGHLCSAAGFLGKLENHSFDPVFSVFVGG